MNFFNKTMSLFVCVGLLAACQNDGGYGSNTSDSGGGFGLNKQTAGTLLGGAAGAWAGSQIGGGSGNIVATGVGAVAGALLGGQIGAYMDDQDRELMYKSTQNSLETGRTGYENEWRNPDSGNYGSVVPQQAYQQNGQYCRDYTQTIYVDGQKEVARGKACRETDGTWRVIG
jgi:surface antigen